MYKKELELGREYLNASTYLAMDDVALKGFSAMYNKFYDLQWEQSNKIRKYLMKRGARVIQPSIVVICL